jgi:hypothetical protein
MGAVSDEVGAQVHIPRNDWDKAREQEKLLPRTVHSGVKPYGVDQHIHPRARKIYLEQSLRS